MLESLAHQGPDGAGVRSRRVRSEGSVGLGHLATECCGGVAYDPQEVHPCAELERCFPRIREAYATFFFLSAATFALNTFRNPSSFQPSVARRFIPSAAPSPAGPQ